MASWRHVTIATFARDTNKLTVEFYLVKTMHFLFWTSETALVKFLVFILEIKSSVTWHLHADIHLSYVSCYVFYNTWFLCDDSILFVCQVALRSDYTFTRSLHRILSSQFQTDFLTVAALFPLTFCFLITYQMLQFSVSSVIFAFFLSRVSFFSYQAILAFTPLRLIPRPHPAHVYVFLC